MGMRPFFQLSMGDNSVFSPLIHEYELLGPLKEIILIIGIKTA